EQLASSQSKVFQLQASLSETQSQQLPMRLELAKIQREKESLLSRCQWLETEMEAKSKDFFELRVQLTSDVTDLKASLDQKAHDISAMEKTIKLLQV